MKTIIGSKYKIDSDGNIYNPKGRMLKPFVHTAKKFIDRGDAVRFAVDIDIGRKMLHVLIAENLIDGWFDGAVVDHIDRNPLNNHPSNLRWVSSSENRKNCDESKRTEKIKETWRKKKDRAHHVRSKMKRIITPIGEFESLSEAQRAHGKQLHYYLKNHPGEYYYAS